MRVCWCRCAGEGDAGEGVLVRVCWSVCAGEGVLVRVCW